MIHFKHKLNISLVLAIAENFPEGLKPIGKINHSDDVLGLWKGVTWNDLLEIPLK